MTNTRDNDTQKHSENLIVFADSGADIEEAEWLAQRLSVEITWDKSNAEHADLMLRLDADGLSLVSGELVLRGDFTHMLPRLRPANLQRELLVRAAKIKNADYTLKAVDATAGLGEDALLLAAAGFSVQLYEYDPVIAALLRDALRRAAELPELAEIVGRMQLLEEDSLAALPQLATAPDVILLDPMFPEWQSSLVQRMASSFASGRIGAPHTPQKRCVWNHWYRCRPVTAASRSQRGWAVRRQRETSFFN